MKTEHSPIFNTFQRQVFESQEKVVKPNKVGDFFRGVKLFFSALSSAFALKNAPLPQGIKSEVKIQRKEEIASLFKAALNPSSVLSDEERVHLKAEAKADAWFNKNLKLEKFKTFREVEYILKGSDPKAVDDLAKQISSEIEKEGGAPPSIDTIRNVIYARAEKAARETYLIDEIQIKDMQATRQMIDVKKLAESHLAITDVEIPEMVCPISIIEKQDLQKIKASHTKLVTVLTKSGKNPELLERTKNELSLIDAVLNDWENRANVKGDIRVASKKYHITALSEEKLKNLEYMRDQYAEALKNEKEPAKIKEISAKLRTIKTILSNKQKYEQIHGSYTKQISRQFLKISPLHVDLKQLALIPMNQNNSEFLVKAWSRVLERNLSIAEKSENPNTRIIAENKYQEAVQRLQLLAKGSNGKNFKEILEKHGVSVEGASETQQISGIKQTESYSELRESARAKLIESKGKSARLTPQEAKSLRLLSKMIRWGRLEEHDKLARVSDKDKRDVEKFLFRSLNNRDFNSRILELGKENIPQGIDGETLEFMKSLSYKSKHHTHFMRLVSKAETVVDHLDRLHELPDDKKLSLRDFGVLSQAADLAGRFEGLEKAGLLREGSYLATLGAKTVRAKELIEEINETVQSDIDKEGTYRSGDIAAWHSMKWEEFLIKKPTHEVELMRRWITDIGHGSFLYRAKPDENGVSKTMQSHIYGTYENEPLDAQQIAFSEIWRMDLTKLTDPSSPLYKLLEQVYTSKGLNAAEEIQKVYEEASREIHEDMKSNFEDMENEEARRFAAGWADYGMKGGHKRKKARTDNFSNVHDQFVSGPKNPGEKKWVICSEFVTKATIASLIETDSRLVKVLEDYLKEHADDPVVKSMADEIIKSSEKEGMHLIDLPYDRSERLKRVHPGRMVQLLHDKNCITKVDPPPTIKGIFTDETFNPGLKTKTLKEQKRVAEALIQKGNFKKGLAMLDKMAKAGAPESYYATTFAQFGLKPGEWSQIAKQKPNVRDPFFNSNIQFTQLEVDALRIIGKVDTDYSGKTKMTEEEKHTVMRFFAHIAQNDSFNKRIGEFARVQAKHDPQMRKFNSNTFRYMREFSYKSGQMGRLNELSPRFQKVWEAVRDKKEDSLKDDDRISLNDYRMIDTFGNMGSFLSWAERRGLAENTFLGKMKSQVDGLDEGMKIINQRFKEEMTYDTGDIILDVMEKGELYDAKPFDPLNKVDWLLKVQKGVVGHTFQHAALAVKKEGSIEMAEMDLSYQNPIVEVGRLCITDVFRIDLSKMMNRRGLAHMRNVEKNKGGGGDLASIDKKIAQHAEERFKAIMAEVMSDPEAFKELSNSAFRQVTTVLRGTKTSTPNDLSTLGLDSPQEIICSEFVARVYGHVIHRVNEEMQAEIKKNLIENRGLSEEYAESLAKKIHLLENPVANANFASIHADRLYDHFEPYLQKVDPPEFMKKIQTNI